MGENVWTLNCLISQLCMFLDINLLIIWIGLKDKKVEKSAKKQFKIIYHYLITLRMLPAILVISESSESHQNSTSFKPPKLSKFRINLSLEYPTYSPIESSSRTFLIIQSIIPKVISIIFLDPCSRIISIRNSTKPPSIIFFLIPLSQL